MLQDGSVTNTPNTIMHVSKVINQESKRLSFQVEKVLQMAVFNEGRLKLKFKEFDVNRMVQTIISNFELRVKNKNGSLESNLDAIDPVIKGDEVHITNVIFNLLDNAVKYSREIPDIQVVTENRKEHVVVSVKDKPQAIIAHTVKGKGVPSLENSNCHSVNMTDELQRECFAVLVD